ncbi:helix-turn-helix domain-containing protein [Georgenia sp. Z1491]|uniref:helix-turn-helix domain-containing protein n=1 Tax=Georgenia sp. Z1491 TaxID=3416707 RepID=UPI003CE7B714
MTAHLARLARNVDVDPDAPLDTWPYEALVAILDRGSIRDWSAVTREIGRDPWGPVARQVEDYLGYESPAGLAPLLRRAIARARRRAEEIDRAAVAARVSELVTRSGLSMADFATRIGTSRSRLSTYRSGTVSPSAALVHRMERLVSAVDLSSPAAAPPAARTGRTAAGRRR